MRSGTAPEASGARGGPWLIIFVDMISLLLTFMVAVHASTDIAEPVWPTSVAALRAGSADTPAPQPTSASVGEAAPLPGLAPGYLALVLGERLQQLPLLTHGSLVYDDDALGLTMPTPAVFSAGDELRPAAADELRRVADAVAPVANAVAVTVSPEPPTGAHFAEQPSAADWEGAIGRALAIGRVLVEGGLRERRLSYLAGGGTAANGIRIVVEAEGERR